MIAPIDPTSSRGYLKRRLFESWIVLATVFLVLAVLFSWVLSALFSGFSPLIFGNIGAGLIAYYAYLVWNKQPMRIRCEECDGNVLCKTPWICGECGHENWEVDKFPFIHQCANCHLAPKAYLCHHCNEPLFLSEDHDATNPARRINAEGRKPQKVARSQQKIEQHFDEKKRNIESARLDLTEAQIKAQIKVAKKGALEVSIQSALDIQLASLMKFMDRATATREAARLLKLQIAEQFKNNKQERIRRNLEVNVWQEVELAKAKEEPRSE